MGQDIDQFCEDPSLKLTNIDGDLRAKIDGKAEHAEQEVRSHLDKVRKRMEHRAPLRLVGGSDSAASSIRFGGFCLWPVQRLLLQDSEPVRVGSRALEILIALVERPGELLSKKELLTRVWPDTFVEPANLTVHISALRRALGDGRDGNRFLINIPGRGYCFVAPVTVSSGRPDPQVLKSGVGEPSTYNEWKVGT